MQGCQCLRVFQQKRKPALFDSPVASADAGIELSLNDFFLEALGATPGKLAVQPIDRRDQYRLFHRRESNLTLCFLSKAPCIIKQRHTGSLFRC